MQGPETSGSIKEIQKLRRRVAKLEQVNRELTKSQSPYPKSEKTQIQWDRTFDAIKDMIMVLDNEFKIVRANQAVSQFAGKSLKEIIGKICCQVMHGTDIPPNECPFRKAQSSKKHEEVKLYVPEKDTWLEAVVDPIIEESGIVSGAIHVIRDITDRRKTGEALRKSEEQHRAIFRGAVDGIIYADRKANIVEVNPAFTEITGIPRQEVVGKSAFSLAKRFAKPKDIPKLLKAISQALKGKPMELYEMEINNKIVEVSTPSIKNESAGITGVIRDVTERYKAIEQLRKGEENYRVLVENANEAIFTIDPDGVFLFMNGKAARELGGEPEDFMGKTMWDLFPSDVAEFQMGSIRQIIRSGKGKVGENETILPRGVRWYRTSSQPLRNCAGDIYAVMMIGTDVTERKKAEEALKINEERFRDIFESTPIGLYQTTPDGRILMANPVLVRMLGYKSFEELAARNLEQEGFGPDYPRFRFKEQIEADDQIVGLESAWIKHDGTTLFVRESVRAIRDSVGNTLYYQGTVEDITEERKAEEKHQAIIKTALDGFCMVDLEGRILEVNDSYCHMIGYSRQELLTMSVPDVEATESSEEVSQHIKKVIKEGSCRFETQHRCKSGKTIDIEVSINCLDRSHGPMFAFLRDITKRKQAEESLRKSEGRFRRLYEKAPLGYQSLSLEGRLIEVNQAWLDLLGYESKEEVIGRWLGDFLAPHEVEANKERFPRFKETGEVHVDLEMKRHDKSIILVHIDGVIARDKQGHFKQTHCILHDITERKRMEEALKRINTLISESQKLAHCGSWEYIADTQETFWSEEEFRIYGLDPTLKSPDYKKLLKKYIHPDDAALLDKTFSKALKKNSTFEMEHRILRPDGSERILYNRAEPHFDDKGKLLKYTGTTLDITERKKAEQERLTYVRHLESMDRINQAIQGTNDLEQMMSHVLDEVLSIFDCDRASLVYPCDPEAQFWTAPMERFRPPYEGVLALGLQVPMDKEVAFCHRLLRSSDEPVPFGQEHENQMPNGVGKRFQIRSQLGMAIYPKDDRPWMFVIHQCSRPRTWTQEEKRLYKEIGRRLEDALTSLIIFRGLHESEEKFAKAFHTSPNLHAMTTLREGRIVEINEAFCLTMGYKREECIGRTTAELNIWADPELRRQIVQKVKAEGHIHNVETELRTKSGKLRTIIFSMATITLNDNDEAYLLSVATDITERRRVEDELVHTREQLQFAIEGSGVGLWDWYVQTGKTTFNEKWANIIGYTLDEIQPVSIGTWIKYAHPDDLKKSNEALERHFQGKSETYECEARMKHKSGDWVWVLDRGKVVEWDTDGKPVRMTGTHLDITERKKAEEALRESEERFRALFEKMPSGVAVYEAVDNGEDFIFKDFNTAAEKIDRINRRDLIGKKVTKAFPGIKEFGVFEVFQRVWKTGKAEYFPDTIYKDNRNSSTWRESWIYKLPSAYIVAVYNDITERKEAEKKLKAIADYTYDWESWFGVDGSLLWLNPAVEKLTGYSMEECHEMSDYPLPIVHPEDRMAFRKLLRQAITERTSINDYSFRISCKDDSIRWMAISWQPIYDDKSEHIGLRTSVRDITERKRDEDALRENEQRFRGTFDQAPIGAAMVSLDYRFMRVNEELCRLTGYSNDELTSLGFPDITHPDDLAADIELAQQLEAGQIEHYSMEKRYIRKDGGIVWVILTVRLIKDLQGKPLYYLPMVEDITERKQAEEALKESELKFRLVTETIEDVFWMSTPGVQEMVYINPSYEKIWGRSRESLYEAPTSFMEAVHPDDRDMLTNIFREYHSLGKTYNCEYRIIPSDGRLRWISERGFPVYDEQINLRYMTGVCTDITERRNTEEAYRSLVDHSLQGLVIFQEGRVVFANQAMAKITGYSVNEMLASPPEKVQNFVHPEDRELVWNRHNERLKGKILPERYEIRSIKKDGSVRWLEIDANLVEYQGKPAIQAAYLDITEIKKAEQQEQEYIRKLRYLSESATEFVKLTPDQDIYLLIAEKLKELSDGYIVAVNTYDQASESLCVRALLGLGKYTQAVTQIMGTNPVGQYFPLADDAKEGLSQGKLLKIPNGIYDLSPGIPRVVCRAIEKLLGLGDVYAMGLNSEGHLYGSITLFTRRKTSLKNHELIETFMNQAAVAIHRWQAAAALRDSERKYRSLFENARDVIATFDTKGNITDVNKAVEEYGFKREQLIGESLFNYIVEDYKAKAIEDFEILINGRPVSGEMDVITPKGIFTIKYSDNPIMRDKEVVGVQAILKDITERKQAEEAIKESEQRFRTLFECAPDGIYLHDMNGTFVDGNKVAEEMTGFKREELIGSNFAESGLLPPEQIPKAIAGLKKSINGEPTGPDEFTLIHKNGSQVPVEIRTFPVRIQDQTLTLGIARDITERKRNEEALRESQENYRMVSEMTSDYIAKVRVEPDGHLVLESATDRLENNTGYPLNELRDQDSWSKIVHPNDYEKFQSFWKEIISSRKSCELLFRGIDQEQEYEWLHAFGKPILDETNERVISIIFTAKDITERKEAEDALRTSEARLSEAMKIAKLAYWEYDVAANVFIFNDQFYSVYHSSVEQVGGYQVLPSRYSELFIHPDDSPLLDQEIRKAIETDDPNFKSDVEHRIIYGDGNIGYVSVRYFVVKDDQGRTVRTYGVNQDITERKRAEEALRESEQKHRELFEHALDAIITFDTNGNITNANKAVEGYGFKREQLIGKPLFDYVVKGHMARAIKDFETLTSGRSVFGEMDVITPKGIFTVNYSDNPIMRGNNVVGIQAILKDVTERKRTEEALRESEQKYRELFENAREAIVIFDMDKRITDANKYVEEYGFSKEDLIGRNYFDFLPEKYKGKAIEDFEKLRRGIPQKGEFEVVTPKGNITVYYRDNPIVRAGRIIGAQSVLTDITERKRAEDELSKYQEKLKAMVSERLIAEERERQRIAIGLHDEICQKLVLSKFMLESSIKSLSDKNMSKSLSIISEAIGETICHAEWLTFELSNPILREFGLITALKKYLDEEIQQQYGISYDFRSDEKLGTLQDDIKNSLFRVIKELLMNIVKHAQAHKISVSVRKRHHKIHVRIRDDGVGFIVANVSSRFLEKKHFGLFSVREQLDHLGGSLNIESEPGQGTAVTIVLPLDKN